MTTIPLSKNSRAQQADHGGDLMEGSRSERLLVRKLTKCAPTPLIRVLARQHRQLRRL